MRKFEERFDEIVAAVESADSIIIASHSNPDGDTLGSALALYHFASRKNPGARITLFDQDMIPFNLRFLPGSDLFTNEVPGEENDLVILVDVGDLERVSEEFAEKVRFRKSIVIDHHLTMTGFGDIKVIEPDAAATGILIYELLSRWDRDLIDSDVATCLYTAIMTDTGSFRFSNTDAYSLRVASDLVELGAVPHRIATEVYENVPVERVRLLAAVLSTLTYDPRGKWAYIVVTTDLLMRIGATPDMLEDIINYVRSIKGLKVAIQFREVGPGKYKVGFRSRGVDVEQIARKFGGGGHKNAAGCRIEGDYPEIVERVIAEVEKVV